MNVSQVLRAATLTMTLMIVASLTACGASKSEPAADGGGSGSRAGSETIGILSVTDQSEFVLREAEAAKVAAEKLGWKVQRIDGKGDPAVWGTAINTFVTQKVAGIITIAVEGSPIAAQLQAAKAAGIPVIATAVLPDPAGADLFDASYAPDDSVYGEKIAERAEQDFPQGTDFVTLELTSLKGARDVTEASTGALEAAGYNEVGKYDMQLATIANEATKGTSDLMQANPDAKFVVGCCDFTAIQATTLLKSLGKPDVVVYSRWDNQSVIDAIRNGAPIVNIANNIDIGMVTAVDQIVAHKVDGTPINKDAAADVWEWKALDAQSLPAKGEFVFPLNDILAPFVARWQDEYGITG